MTNDEVPPRLECAAAHVLRGEHVCHECGCIVPVFTLLLSGPFKVQGDVYLEDDDETPLLHRVAQIPAPLSAVLMELSGGRFRVDFSRTVDEAYAMNHCRECDAKIGDWYVHKPGQAFFPTNDEEMSKVFGTRVEGPFVFDAPQLSQSSWTTRWMRMCSGNIRDFGAL